MSDLVPQKKDMNQEEKKEEETKEEKEIKEDETKEEVKEEAKEEVTKEEKEENVKEKEGEKSEEEEEKSESSKDSGSESDESKNSKKSEESKDKKEKDSEENEEADDDDDDVDVDDESDESTSEKKQKDPYHGYLISKTQYKNFFFENIYENNYVYGIKQNQFYKFVNYKNLTNDKKVQINKYTLKELKNTKESQNVNSKLMKNIQYMASVYGNAVVKDTKEKDKKEKSKDLKSINEDIREENLEGKNEKKKEETKKEEKEEDKKDENKKNENEEKEAEKSKETVEEKKKEEIKEGKEGEKIEDNKEKEKTKENKEEEKAEEKTSKETKDKTKSKEENKEKDKDKKGEKESKKKKSKKPKNSDLIVVIKDLSEYTFFQNIRVIYINSQNNPIVFYLKININITIKELIDQFSSLFRYKTERRSDKLPLHIFINGKKHSISNTTRNKYFIPTKFDYKNDYVLILEKQIFKFSEVTINGDTNKINLKGIEVPHLVYNALYNYEIDSFVISEGLESLECKIYELKNNIEIRQYTDNESTIRRKLMDFLLLNWKERTTLLTSFSSVKVKKGKSWRTQLAELNRKFILRQGKMYVFLIKSSNKTVRAFSLTSRYISTEGIFIVSRNNKSLIDGFRAKKISDFYAYS